MKKKRSQRHIMQLLQHAELLIPVLIFLSIYFYHDIADLAFPQLCEFNLLFILLLPYCLIPMAFFYTAISRIKSRNTKPTQLKIFSTIWIVLSISLFGVFFKDIEYLQERVMFETHKPLFDEIVDLGTSNECYQQYRPCPYGYEIVYLPEDISNVIGHSSIWISAHKETPAVTLFSRNGIAFVYLPHYKEPPALWRTVMIQLECISKLDNGWFLCETYSTQ